MDDGSPELGVGFLIDPGGSFDQLTRLQEVMNSTEAKVMKDAAAIERATGGMVNAGPAIAQITSFGNAATKELQSVARERSNAEKAGERLSRQLDREAAAFGKSRGEIRAAKVETAALAAEKAGLTDLAERLRAQQAALAAQQEAAAAAATREAQALRDAAFAHQMFEARVRQGVVAMREEEAAVRADAAAKADLAARAMRLVESVNPAAAAQNRFNAEMAEARALVSAGAISLDDYVAKLRMERGALDATNAALGRGAASAGAHRQAMLGASYQVQDFLTQISMGANPLNAFAVQGSQLAGQFAAVEGKAGALARFFIGPWGLAITGAVLAIGALTKGLFDNDDATGKLTLNLDIQKNSYDTLIRAVREYNETQRDSAALTAQATEEAKKQALANIDLAKAKLAAALASERANAGQGTGGVAGSYSGFDANNRRAELLELQQQLRDIERGLADQNIDARLNKEVEINVRIGKQLNDLTAAQAAGTISTQKYTAERERLLALKEKELKAAREAKREADSMRPVQMGRDIDLAEARRIAESIGAQVTSTKRSLAEQQRLYDKYMAYKAGKGPWAALAAKPGTSDHELGNAMDIAKTPGMSLTKIRDAFRAAGVSIKQLLDEGSHFHVAWKKGADSAASASQRLAERLAREADAVDAQIKNTYALADAYKDSGVAALVAEARVKAESDAIRKRGDIEAAVNRQIQIAIAQRVVDAAKSAAAMREQADAQETVNAMVAAGLVPASAAADLVKDQLDDLPLLTAIQAAQQRGLTDEAKKATAALEEQRQARLRLRDIEEQSRFQRDIADGEKRLATLREEGRLIGATNADRERALALLKATQDAEQYNDPARRSQYIAQQLAIVDLTELNRQKQDDYNASLTHAAEMWDLIARNVQNAAQGMSDAFGSAGAALGGLASIYADFQSERARADAEHIQRLRDAGSAEAKAQEQARHALATSTMQLGLYGDMTSAAKGFFKEKSAGYKAMMAAEKVFRAFEFAMSLKAMVQDVAETVSSVTNSAARATAAGTEGIAEQAKLPFPFNIAAMAATGAALIAAGVAVIGALGGKSKPLESNKGTGTVLGDPSAQSESIKNAINALKDVDTVMLTYSRQMAGSLKAIESNISGFASLLVRNGDSLNASGGISEGFKTNAIGSILSKIPLVGGILGSLFGTKTTVLASGLYGSAQSLGSILSGGFDGQTYSDIQKKKKLFGITTSNKTSTQYGSLDPTIENQFTLILREFNNAIIAAAGPLGAATNDIQQKLNGFIVNIGKIDLKGLTGTEIEEKLNAVFGAAADRMAVAAFPMIQQFQKAGEGAFETLVRVASTLESVTSTLDLLGQSAQGMSIAAKLGLADQFDSVSDLTSAVDSYFQSFYTKEEQAAARTAQMGKVFESLGLAMPTTLAGFRELVEAQNLNTAAGQEVYATLLKLAPAFADLQAAMDGAKSAADIASERADLQRQLLELQGDTAALRALQLAKLDASNRALQEEIWALQDAQAAAKAAQDLADAWKSAGDSIMDEVRRIRGLTDAGGGNSFAALMSQFNAATSAARGGDIDAAKSLPQLSQALLAAAQDAATSRQELDRIRAQTAASLEATNGLIGSLSGTSAASTNAALLGAAAASQSGTTSANDNGSAAVSTGIDELREETAQLRAALLAALAPIAANTGSMKKTLDNVTADSGGDAVSTRTAAA